MKFDLKNLCALLCLATLLSACGGSAGEGNTLDSSDPNRINIVESFVGIWDITGNWKGIPDDEAVLVFSPLEDNGESIVRLFDLDDNGENCYFRSSITGRAFESFDTTQVFLNSEPFADAVITPVGDTMNILFFDANDIDSDGDTQEQLTYSATKISNMMEDDLQVCVTTGTRDNSDHTPKHMI